MISRPDSSKTDDSSSANSMRTAESFFTESLDLQSQPWALDDNPDFDLIADDDDEIDYAVFKESFKDMTFLSLDLRRSIGACRADKKVEEFVEYDSSAVFNKSILDDYLWYDPLVAKEAIVNGILSIPYEERPDSLNHQLTEWIMSVWSTIASMGCVKCGGISKLMKYLIYGEGDTIICKGLEANEVNVDSSMCILVFLIIVYVADVHSSIRESCIGKG
jgi:hypothetical protein